MPAPTYACCLLLDKVKGGKKEDWLMARCRWCNKTAQKAFPRTPEPELVVVSRTERSLMPRRFVQSVTLPYLGSRTMMTFLPFSWDFPLRQQILNRWVSCTARVWPPAFRSLRLISSSPATLLFQSPLMGSSSLLSKCHPYWHLDRHAPLPQWNHTWQ